jgi:vesicle-fusing ATPase
MSILLHGPSGCGKTALGAHIAQTSEFPFLRYVGPNNFVGMGEATKLREIVTCFEDAYKSDLSLIVLDDLERLLDYVRIGPRFSNAVLQTLMVLVKKAPTNPNRKLVIIGTCSDTDFLRDCELFDAFNVALGIPLVTPESIGHVLDSRGLFSRQALESLQQHVERPLGIRDVFQVSEMAIQKAQTSKQPMDAQLFLECFSDCGIDIGGMRM